MSWISGGCADEPREEVRVSGPFHRVTPTAWPRLLELLREFGRALERPDVRGLVQRPTVTDLTGAADSIEQGDERWWSAESRGFRVTDSVPAVRAMIAALREEGGNLRLAAVWWAKSSAERYTIELLGPRGMLVDHLDTCRWRLAVDNRRWLAQDATDGYPDEHWWHIWRGVLALRWTLNQRRGAPEGFLPSREVALREPRAVVPR